MALEYDYPLFRPPAEANNIILQVTLGCSYNNCSFCSMYKTKEYSVKSLDEVKSDIETLSSLYPNATKVFLADGDALALSSEHLVKILQLLKENFPKLRRVSLYASTQNIQAKTLQELELLKANKLNLIYYGIESGSQTVLKKITKGVNQIQIIDSLNLASDAGLKISVTVILGIGGKEYSKEHIEQTAEIINATRVNYLSTLQLGLEEDAKENFYKYFHDFKELEDEEILKEQKKFLELLNPSNKIIFRSNHASNALHLEGTLPRDTQRLIAEVVMSLEIGEASFVPRKYRGF